MLATAKLYVVKMLQGKIIQNRIQLSVRYVYSVQARQTKMNRNERHTENFFDEWWNMYRQMRVTGTIDSIRK